MRSGRLLVAAAVLGHVVAAAHRPIGADVSANADTFDPADPERWQHYLDMRTVDAADLRLDDPERRVLFVGDIHGHWDPLNALLRKVRFDVDRDILIHTGDIITKGPASDDVLAWLAAHNITGVRGNHDQAVVAWRGWMDWVESHKGGAKWLDKMEKRFPADDDDDLKKKKKKTKVDPALFPMPEEWDFNDMHYRVARALRPAETAYLRALPLTLHVRPLHTLVVHAGLLPLDPTRPPTAPRQPLASVPSPPTRAAQEAAIVRDVPQNVPWSRLNVRAVTPDGTSSRDASDGEPWAPLWNTLMARCSGFDSTFRQIQDDAGGRSLPCHPATVVYGHAASRGLDLRPWSKGLDTGCANGRRLTGLLLGERHAADLEAKVDDVVDFGEHGAARLFSVSCKDDNLWHASVEDF